MLRCASYEDVQGDVRRGLGASIAPGRRDSHKFTLARNLRCVCNVRQAVARSRDADDVASALYCALEAGALITSRYLNLNFTLTSTSSGLIISASCRVQRKSYDVDGIYL